MSRNSYLPSSTVSKLAVIEDINFRGQSLAQTLAGYDSVFASVTDNGQPVYNDIGTLTSQEVNQLKTIDTAVISNDNWQKVSNLDQNLSTGSTVKFAEVTVTSPPTSSSALVSKAYVDTKVTDVSSSGTAYTDNRISSTKADIDGSIQDLQTLVNKKVDASNTYTKSEINTFVNNKQPRNVNLDLVDQSLATTNDVFFNTISTNTTPTQAKHVATKTYVDNGLSTKADTSSVYTRGNTDILLANKVNNSDFTAYSNSTGTLIGTKANSSDVYLKGQTYSRVEADNLLSLKSDSATTYQKATVDTLLGQKVSSTDLATYQQSTSALIGSKLDTSVFNTSKTALENSIGTKVSQATYDTYVASNNANVASKAPQSTTYTKTEVNSALAARLPTSEFDAYKTSTDQALSERVTTAFFQQYDTQVASNITSLGQQISQRLKIADFDNYRNTTSNFINTKQDANAYLGSINQALSTGDSPSFAGITVSGTPSSASSVTTKSYVDGIALAGTGLTKTEGTLSVNPIQSQITQVGTLANLNVTGNIVNGNYVILPYNNGIESLRFTRRDGSYDQHLIGTDPNAARPQFNIKNLSGSGIIQISTVGNGLINFEGGLVSVNNATDSTSSTSGALKVAGGLGIAKSVYVGGELFVSNAVGSRLKLQSNGGSYFLGSVDQDMSGNVHLYSATHNSRIWGYYSDNTFRIGFYNGTTVLMATGTADATSSASGALQVLGGIGVSKGIFVAGSSTLNSLLVTGASTFSGSFTVSGATTMNTLLVSGDLTQKGQYYTLDGIGCVKGNVGFYVPGDTPVNALATTAGIKYQRLGGINPQGQLGCAMFFSNESSEDPGHFIFSKFKDAFTASTAPLLEVKLTGITAPNYSSGTITNSSTQAGTVQTKSIDDVNYAITGRIARVAYQLVLTAVTGTVTGPMSFTLPKASAATFTMDTDYHMFRNGSGVTNMRLSFTQNSTNVTIQVSNGFGAYQNFAATATENMLLSFQYLTV